MINWTLNVIKNQRNWVIVPTNRAKRLSRLLLALTASIFTVAITLTVGSVCVLCLAAFLEEVIWNKTHFLEQSATDFPFALIGFVLILLVFFLFLRWGWEPEESEKAAENAKRRSDLIKRAYSIYHNP